MIQDKSQSPSTTIFIPQPAAAGQQGWSTVGGKSAQKATPWGTQPNRKYPWEFMGCDYHVLARYLVLEALLIGR